MHLFPALDYCLLVVHSKRKKLEPYVLGKLYKVLQDRMRIQELRCYFIFLKFLHLHREYNSQEDKLSKVALQIPLGLMVVEEFDKDTMLSYFSINPL